MEIVVGAYLDCWLVVGDVVVAEKVEDEDFARSVDGPSFAG
jgi:hypothetical protein